MQPLTTFVNGESVKITTYNWCYDLIFFEGPVVSVIEMLNYQMIVIWNENDNVCNRWLAFKVTDEQIRDYRAEKISLRSIVDLQSHVFFIDINDNLEIVASIQQPRGDVLEIELPTYDSFADKDFIC